MKKIIILFLALALTACASIRNPITTNQLAVVESTYGVALSIAVAYHNTRLCKKTETPSLSNICAQRAIILKLQAADRQAQAALVKARLFIRNNPTLDAFAVIQAAQDAVDLFRGIEAQYGIN